MNGRIVMLGLVTLGTAAFHASPADAQAHTGSQDLQIYAGEAFGDRLTDMPLSGKYPVLNDDIVFGGRYTYDFTDQWALQLSAGYDPSRAAHVTGGASNLALTTVDLDVLRNITPGLAIDGRTLMPYAEIGVGYAWANLDHSLYGVTGNTPVTLTDSTGYTANAGFGVKYYLTNNFFADFDARYRYLSRLIDNDGRGLNTGETTFSLGYRF